MSPVTGEVETPLLFEEQDSCKRCRRYVRKEAMTDFMLLMVSALFLLAAALICFILAIMFTRKFMSITLPNSVYSPAHVAREFQAVKFDGALNTSNPWKGPPSDDLDKAWNELFQLDPIAITSEDLKKIEKTGVEIPSRPGAYLAKLAVFHQLHCLDMVRRYVHNDYYRLDDSHSSVSLIDHIDHCIDILRQVITCKADTTLITFRPRGLLDVDPDFEATHSCANFGRIHRWAKVREINMTREYTEHPEAFQRAMLERIKKMQNETGSQTA
ncbi:hypothetical protein VTO42DRAFT_7216 [Malbranchea cinnamomea]